MVIKAKLDEKEAEKLIIEMGKSGMTSEKIGQKMKDEHGQKKSTVKISKILKENNLYVNPDIKNLTEIVAALKNHLAKNRKDQPTRRALMIKESKLRKLNSL